MGKHCDMSDEPIDVFVLHSGGSEHSLQYGLFNPADPDFDYDKLPDTRSALSGVNRGLITDTDAFISSLEQACSFDHKSAKAVLVEPIPTIQQHYMICEVMFELRQQEAIYELPSGMAALMGAGRVEGITVDVGTDLIQCQMIFQSYDLLTVFNQASVTEQGVVLGAVQCKQVGSADFELPDGAIVPTMDLIQECKSSLPPGLTYKWDQEALDAFKRKEDVLLELPSTLCFPATWDVVNTTLLSGLGLPERLKPGSRYDW